MVRRKDLWKKLKGGERIRRRGKNRVFWGFEGKVKGEEGEGVVRCAKTEPKEAEGK